MNKLLILSLVSLLILACTISTKAVSIVNTESYVATESAFKRATFARPPAPVLNSRGEKGLP